MEPGYRLRIGAHVMSGRDQEYVPAVVGQFEQFPDLRLTVHELMLSGDRLALRMSEQGSSNRHQGRTASWAGIVLHRWNGRRLVETFAEEDYFSRRRQLASGVPDPAEAPAPAPWEVLAQAPDPAAERAVRDWLLESGGEGGQVSHDEGGAGRLLEVAEVQIHELFSAGDRVAFHALAQGSYAGGLEGSEAAPGSPAGMNLAGIVRVEGGVVTGRVVRDRMGLQRSLQRPAAG